MRQTSDLFSLARKKPPKRHPNTTDQYQGYAVDNFAKADDELSKRVDKKSSEEDGEEDVHRVMYGDWC